MHSPLQSVFFIPNPTKNYIMSGADGNHPAPGQDLQTNTEESTANCSQNNLERQSSLLADPANVSTPDPTVGPSKVQSKYIEENRPGPSTQELQYSHTVSKEKHLNSMIAYKLKLSLKELTTILEKMRKAVKMVKSAINDFSAARYFIEFVRKKNSDAVYNEYGIRRVDVLHPFSDTILGSLKRDLNGVEWCQLCIQEACKAVKTHMMLYNCDQKGTFDVLNNAEGTEFNRAKFPNEQSTPEHYSIEYLEKARKRLSSAGDNLREVGDNVKHLIQLLNATSEILDHGYIHLDAVLIQVMLTKYSEWLKSANYPLILTASIFQTGCYLLEYIVATRRKDSTADELAYDSQLGLQDTLVDSLFSRRSAHDKKKRPGLISLGRIQNQTSGDQSSVSFPSTSGH